LCNKVSAFDYVDVALMCSRCAVRRII